MRTNQGLIRGLLGLLLCVGLQPLPTYGGPVSGNELEARLDQCILGLVEEGEGSPETDAVVHLDQRCPGLSTWIHASSLASALQPRPSSEMTLASLSDLRALVRANRVSALPSLLDPETIPAVLARTWQRSREDSEQGWWERFKAWLREHLGNSDEMEFPGWLEDWLRGWKPSTGALETVLWSLTAVVLVMVAAVVVTELRAAGWFVRRRRVQGSLDASGQASDAAMPWYAGSLAGIDDLPPGPRAVALMNALLRLSWERGWLAPDESRTNRELLAELRGAHQAESLLFSRVLAQSEAWLYGGRCPNERVLGPLSMEVRRLAAGTSLRSRSESASAPVD